MSGINKFFILTFNIFCVNAHAMGPRTGAEGLYDAISAGIVKFVKERVNHYDTQDFRSSFILGDEKQNPIKGNLLKCAIDAYMLDQLECTFLCQHRLEIVKILAHKSDTDVIYKKIKPHETDNAVVTKNALYYVISRYGSSDHQIKLCVLTKMLLDIPLFGNQENGWQYSSSEGIIKKKSIKKKLAKLILKSDSPEDLNYGNLLGKIDPDFDSFKKMVEKKTQRILALQEKK